MNLIKSISINVLNTNSYILLTSFEPKTSIRKVKSLLWSTGQPKGITVITVTDVAHANYTHPNLAIEI